MGVNVPPDEPDRFTGPMLLAVALLTVVALLWVGGAVAVDLMAVR